MRILAYGILLLSVTSVSASTIRRDGHISATGACQAPLPIYDQYLRKRPIAMTNESARSVFVSCSAPNHAYLGSSYIEVTVLNPTPTDASFTCTLTEGSHSTFGGDWYYIPRTIVVPARSVTSMNWIAHRDNGDEPFFRINFNCLLPPSLEIGEINNLWDEQLSP